MLRGRGKLGVSGKLGVRVQIHSFLFSTIYSASVLGSIFIRLFHSVLLNVWLTLAALRIFSLAAIHPQDFSERI
jgi:hypothetical protein